jgi:hypothetical protein
MRALPKPQSAGTKVVLKFSTDNTGYLFFERFAKCPLKTLVDRGDVRVDAYPRLGHGLTGVRA